MFLEINGIRTHYIRQGSGETVLILHGWGCNVKVYESMTQLMSKKYEVIALDLPGFGETDEPKAPFSVGDYADFVQKFIKAIGVQKTILLGHSLGGRIIIKIMSSGKVDFEVPKIILVDAAGIRPKRSFKQKCKTRIYKVSKWTYGLSLIKKIYPEGVEKLRKKNGSADYNAASPMMRQTLVKVVNEDLTECLSKIKPDTLLIWGENDTATPVSDGQLMEKLIPKAGLAVIKNAGHYSFLDQRITFEKILASYLKI
ncbi:MAG: alpha/beta hydrolase [Bacillota bacterium]|nr:alpha/beta hydrolase [Bacillota bacterium]